MPKKKKAVKAAAPKKVKVKAAKCGNCITDNANIRTWGETVEARV